MPKKTPNNRLKSLFTSLDTERSSPAFPQPTPQRNRPDGQPVADQSKGGWSWECDQYGFYTFCSDEVIEILGITPEKFSEQSIYDFAIIPDSGQALRKAI
ncbi:MAG TPA: PAS domain-containing protein, partial [Anaerolineaceae bacterium]|nr:PAS domain-containing protein [Anaerolineaceae bacterium]